MNTRRGFFGSLFGGIAAALCPRPAPAGPSPAELDEMYERLVELYRDPIPVEFSEFEFYTEPNPLCYIAENGQLKRVYPGKEHL